MTEPDVSAEPEQEAASIEPKTRPRSWRSGRVPRLAFVGAVLGASYFLLPALPRDHQVVLKLDDPASVVGLEVDWSAERGVDASDLVRGGRWQFEEGRAPASITSNVRVPDGSYHLRARVLRSEGSDAIDRTITLGDAASITVSLR